jgi:hypothetical protein
MEECKQCKVFEAIIDELSEELSRVQRERRNERLATRLFKAAVVSEMEEEHALSQADGFGDDHTCPGVTDISKCDCGLIR